MHARVMLQFGADGEHGLALAALTGEDERRAAEADVLLSRLAVAAPGCVHGAALERLTIGDRDRALAALYRALYGTAIVADATCGGCGARYEMRFDLGALLASRQPDGSADGDPPAIRLGETLLRLPRRDDLTGAPEALPQRLTLAGPVPDLATAAAALEAADPALALDLAGTCPECETRQAVPFSMAGFLERALERDRVFLAREIHLIASSYRWSHAEILALTRAERQGFARLLIAEREAASAPLRQAS